jgi:hypothetical protein
MLSVVFGICCNNSWWEMSSHARGIDHLILHTVHTHSLRLVHKYNFLKTVFNSDSLGPYNPRGFSLMIYCTKKCTYRYVTSKIQKLAIEKSKQNALNWDCGETTFSGLHVPERIVQMPYCSDRRDKERVDAAMGKDRSHHWTRPSAQRAPQAGCKQQYCGWLSVYCY